MFAWKTHLIRSALVLVVSAPMVACDLGRQVLDATELPDELVDELDPTVALDTPVLVKGPTLIDLGAYYCPTVIDDPIVGLSCALTLGSPPPKETMSFEFSLPLTIANPNDIPVPTLDVLVAMTVFEGAEAQEVGAICVSMCTEDTPDCDGKPRGADACTDDEDTIDTVDDIKERLPGLISDVLTGKALEEIKNWETPEGGDIKLDLTFALGVDPAISIFEKVALEYVSALLAGTETRMEVPIAGHGAVFFRLPVAGRIGVNYGPVKGTWVIE